MSVGSKLLSSITGINPKAILCVRKMEKGTGENQGKLSAVKAAGDVLNGVSLPGQTAPEGFVMMEVQYNPNTLYMESQGSEQIKYSGGALGSDSDNQLVQITQPVFTTLSFQLIFDDVNNFDAFSADNLNFSLTSIGKGIASNFKKYSVRTQVEGLLATLVQTETREVIFMWGKMSFRGNITSVNATYTMFNAKGNPIRAVVDISIRQNDEGDEKTDDKYWTKAYEDLFKEESLLSGAASKLSKATNNGILNLNL